MSNPFHGTLTDGELETLLDSPEAVEIFSSSLKWAETFLITPVDSTPFRANYVQTQILSSGCQFNAIRVRRRGGKSFSYVILSLYYALTRPSCEILIAAPSQPHVSELFATLRDFIRVNEWVAHHVTSDTKSPNRIEFTNGSRIKGFTTGAKTRGKGLSLRGQGADLFLIDEAAYLADEDWQALKAIMMGDEYPA